MDPHALIARYLIGDVTEDEVKELERALSEDSSLRREFAVAAATDTSLRELAYERAVEQRTEDSALGAVVNGSDAKPSRWTKPSLLRWVMASALAASVLFAMTGFWRSDRSVATLASSENAAWESTLPTAPGSKLGQGVLKLKAGVATVRFHSGAEVVLEAPAEFEIVSSMRGKIVTGAALIEVPESAIGFVIETPDGFAVDYGTKFAVRVDPGDQLSSFELIEGEIAVHHPDTGDEIRLRDEGKRAAIADRSLSIVDPESQSEDVTPPRNVIRIGTNGRWGSAIRNDKRKKYIRPEILSVKNTKLGSWRQRSFFAFDLSAVDTEEIDEARLRLNLVPSDRGSVTRLPKINRFSIYGLTNDAKSDWPNEALWREAPGPEDGIWLGTFEIARSQSRGNFGIATDELLEFLKSNAGREVTMILVRETTQISGQGSGPVHSFASDSHAESVGPVLELAPTTEK